MPRVRSNPYDHGGVPQQTIRPDPLPDPLPVAPPRALPDDGAIRPTRAPVQRPHAIRTHREGMGGQPEAQVNIPCRQPVLHPSTFSTLIPDEEQSVKIAALNAAAAHYADVVDAMTDHNADQDRVFIGIRECAFWARECIMRHAYSGVPRPRADATVTPEPMPNPPLGMFYDPVSQQMFPLGGVIDAVLEPATRPPRLNVGGRSTPFQAALVRSEGGRP